MYFMLQYGRGVPVVRTDVEHRQVVVSEEKGCRERKILRTMARQKKLGTKTSSEREERKEGRE